MSQIQNGTKEMLSDKRTYTVEEVTTERRAFQSCISGVSAEPSHTSLSKRGIQNRANRKRHTHFQVVKISDFLYDFVSLYGEKKRGVSSCRSRQLFDRPELADQQLHKSDYRRYGSTGGDAARGGRICSDLAKDSFRFHKDAQGYNDL